MQHETENAWLGEQGFPYKTGRSCFLGIGQVAKTELEDHGICQVSLTSASRKRKLTLVQICDLGSATGMTFTL